jgi:hypothetical protein
MKISHLTFIAIACLFSASCERAKKNLIHTVSDFGVPVSCISSSPDNNAILFVGLENGNIVRMNAVDNSRTILNAGNNRIYDICVENDTTLWVSLRNEGVKRIVNGIVTQKYYISNPLDTVKPTSSFAAYNIKMDRDSLYFATSSGVYTLNKNNREKDSLLHLYYRAKNHPYYHFGINQLFINNSNIYAATSDSGLVVLNKDNPENNKNLITNEVLHFCQQNDSILYASSSSSIYKINMKQPLERQKAIPITNKDDNIFAYIVDPVGKTQREWTLTSTEVKYKDENGKASLLLSDKLSSSYKNYVYKGANFIRIACYNKLYTFPLRQNMKGKSNNVIAACANEHGLCYFITLDNKLYSVGRDEIQAKLIGNLNVTIAEKPVRFHAGKKYIWLITNNLLYKINPDNAAISMEAGAGGSDAKKKINAQKVDFRSIHEDNNCLFIGTRNYLLRVNPDSFEKIDSIPTCKNAKVDFSDLYISDISDNYFASMKHGIFELNAKDSLEKIAGSDTIGEIRRFVKSTKDDSYIYTSKGVYKLEENRFDLKNVRPKSILTVYDRTDGFYIIGHKGIMTMEKKNDPFFVVNKDMDISVNETAIAEIANKKFLFVGAQTGLYRYGEHNDITPIEIPSPDYTVIHITLFFAAIIVIVIITIFLYSAQKRRIKDKLRRCSEKITRNIKKKTEDELISKKNELENKLKSVNLFEIQNFKKEVDDFEDCIEENLLKRIEIIDAIKKLINKKIEEINKILDNNNSQDEWNDILLENDKIANEDSDRNSIDYSFKLFDRILEFEEGYLNKSMITQTMTDLQKKDFDELRNIFITKENCKNTENEHGKNEKQQKEEEKRNRIKLKCEKLLDKYREELSGLKLKNNTKKSYVALLLISGRFDNADIEETMNFSRVGDDRYNIHENLKQRINKNALLTQLFENTRPSR